MEYDYFVKQRIVVLVLRITDFPKKVFLMQCSDVLLVLESFMTERGQMLGKGWSIPSFWYFTFVSPLSSIKHNVQQVELLLHIYISPSGTRYKDFDTHWYCVPVRRLSSLSTVCSYKEVFVKPVKTHKKWQVNLEQIIENEN